MNIQHIIITKMTKNDYMNIKDVNDVYVYEDISYKGETYEFNFDNTINFEFWSNEDVRVKLNSIPMDNFFSDGDLALRGSYEVDKSQLYVGFYRHSLMNPIE